MVFAAGCSHLPQVGQPSSPNSNDVSIKRQNNAKEGETQQRGAELPDQSSSAAIAVTESPEQRPQIDASNRTEDLLDRIRSGFALPDYQSKIIAEYERWNSQHSSYLKDLFSRAEPFLYYIVEELESRGMPLDLALLPAVESAFKPRAYSRSSAAGLWQFIPSTGRHFGLRQDWWYDGRLDLIAATQAALDYLQELNSMFDGDWLLTLAAYNAGQGTIRRAIAKNKKKRRGTGYQDLKLRRETTRYVPKLYALRNIIMAPEKFGVTLPAIPNEPYFTVLELPGQVDLKRFARESGIGIRSLRHINSGHRRWATAPTGPHRLLVPLSAKIRANETLERLASEPLLRYKDYTIRQGDTLSAIARHHDVSVSALQQANGLRNSRIRAGKTLLIPSGPISTNAQFNAVAASGSNDKTHSSEKKIVHRVIAGETLWSISRRYRVKINQLLNWNQLSANQILNLNQTLTVFLN